MQQIHLLLDIGNSRVKMALTRPEAFLGKAPPLRSADLTAEGLLAAFSTLLAAHHVEAKDLAGALLCSVVPNVESLVFETIAPLLSVPLHAVPKHIPVPLTTSYLTPQTLGSDRLVEAYAARKLFPASKLIVVDLGTAITIDCVENASFLGGLILPGPSLARQALARATAQLPEVTLSQEMAPFSPGQSTEACIAIGLAWGLRVLVRGLVEESRRYLGGQATVVGTGGYAQSFQDLFDEVRPDLVLEGLRLLSSDRS